MEVEASSPVVAGLPLLEHEVELKPNIESLQSQHATEEQATPAQNAGIEERVAAAESEAAVKVKAEGEGEDGAKEEIEVVILPARRAAAIILSEDDEDDDEAEDEVSGSSTAS